MSMPNLSVEGKTAIVTGASKGIGQRLATGFAEAGASVVLAARSVAALESTAREIESAGGRALPVPTDVTNGASVAALAERAVDAFGTVDVLINCAGGTGKRPFVPLLEMEEREWDFVLNLNLRGVYLCCRAIGRLMVAQKRGSIINISSGAGTRPIPGQTHYGGAKAGLNHFTRVLATEWGRYNVRVNAISPGLIATEASRQFLDPKRYEKFAKAIPLGRAGEPEDILGTALYLASEASAFITGVVIPVGGGPE